MRIANWTLQCYNKLWFSECDSLHIHLLWIMIQSHMKHRLSDMVEHYLHASHLSNTSIISITGKRCLLRFHNHTQKINLCMLSNLYISTMQCDSKMVVLYWWSLYPSLVFWERCVNVTLVVNAIHGVFENGHVSGMYTFKNLSSLSNIVLVIMYFRVWMNH